MSSGNEPGQLSGEHRYAHRRLRERRPTPDITGPPSGTTSSHVNRTSAAPVHVVVGRPFAPVNTSRRSPFILRSLAAPRRLVCFPLALSGLGGLSLLTRCWAFRYRCLWLPLPHALC